MKEVLWLIRSYDKLLEQIGIDEHAVLSTMKDTMLQLAGNERVKRLGNLTSLTFFGTSFIASLVNSLRA